MRKMTSETRLQEQYRGAGVDPKKAVHAVIFGPGCWPCLQTGNQHNKIEGWRVPSRLWLVAETSDGCPLLICPLAN